MNVCRTLTCECTTEDVSWSGATPTKTIWSKISLVRRCDGFGEDVSLRMLGDSSDVSVRSKSFARHPSWFGSLSQGRSSEQNVGTLRVVDDLHVSCLLSLMEFVVIVKVSRTFVSAIWSTIQSWWRVIRTLKNEMSALTLISPGGLLCTPRCHGSDLEYLCRFLHRSRWRLDKTELARRFGASVSSPDSSRWTASIRYWCVSQTVLPWPNAMRSMSRRFLGWLLVVGSSWNYVFEASLREGSVAQHVPHVLQESLECFPQADNNKPAIGNKKPASVPQAKQVQAWSPPQLCEETREVHRTAAQPFRFRVVDSRWWRPRFLSNYASSNTCSIEANIGTLCQDRPELRHYWVVKSWRGKLFNFLVTHITCAQMVVCGSQYGTVRSCGRFVKTVGSGTPRAPCCPLAQAHSLILSRQVSPISLAMCGLTPKCTTNADENTRFQSSRVTWTLSTPQKCKISLTSWRWTCFVDLTTSESCVPVHWVNATTMCGLARNTWELMSTSANHLWLLWIGPRRKQWRQWSNRGSVPRVWRFRPRVPLKALGFIATGNLSSWARSSSSTATRSIRIGFVTVSDLSTVNPLCKYYDPCCLLDGRHVLCESQSCMHRELTE